jgi:hypothetical protein
MKNYGSVDKFDGYNGIILGIDGKEYLFFDKEIMDEENILVGDKVSFIPNVYSTVEVQCDLARFVRKLEKID